MRQAGSRIVRLTIGAMFVWVFFENLGKGVYTPAGYAGLINYYIKSSHSPAAWKAVMALAASHAAMAAPMQAITEISLGNPAGRRSAYASGCFCRISVPRQPLGVRMGNGVDMGTAGSGARVACAGGGACRSNVGHRRVAGAAAGRPRRGGDLSEDRVRVSVIIPTHNEAQAIGRVLSGSACRSRHRGYGCRQQFN